MRQIFAPIFLSLPCVLAAQQTALPPSSACDGVFVQHAGINAGANHWGSTSSLGAYRVSGNGFQNPLTPGAQDNQLGLTWNTTPPATFESARQSLNLSGCTLRVIFVGETAGWLNDFGYTYGGNPAGSGSYTVWKDIQSYGQNRNIAFGDYFDLSLEAGQMNSLDLWFKSEGSWRKTLCGDKYTGGTYTLFGSPGDPSQFLWADRSLAVNTWIPSIATSLLVDSYLVSMEDWRLDRGADGDFNDFRFAVQFLNNDGTPLAVIPEPAHVAALVSLLAFTFALSRERHNRQTA